MPGWFRIETAHAFRPKRWLRTARSTARIFSVPVPASLCLKGTVIGSGNPPPRGFRGKKVPQPMETPDLAQTTAVLT